MCKMLLAMLMIVGGCAASPLPGPDEAPAPVAPAPEVEKPDMGHRAPKEPTCGLYGQGCCCLANGGQACGCADGLVCGAGPDGTCGFVD